MPEAARPVFASPGIRAGQGDVAGKAKSNSLNSMSPELTRSQLAGQGNRAEIKQGTVAEQHERQDHPSHDDVDAGKVLCPGPAPADNPPQVTAGKHTQQYGCRQTPTTRNGPTVLINPQVETIQCQRRYDGKQCNSRTQQAMEKGPDKAPGDQSDTPS